MASRNTPLKQALQKKQDKPRVTPLDVFERARSLWLQGERLNLGSLAETLGVSRATLFRWVGNKELLMGEILWSTYKPLVDRALAQATGKGVDFMVDVFRRVNLDIMQSESLRQFMSQDPAYALQVLTSKDSTIHARAVALNTELLQQEVTARRIKPPLSVESLSYFMVRLGESCIYSEMISGIKPDARQLEEACIAIRILLGGK